MTVNIVLKMPIIFGLVVVFLEMYLKKMNEGLCSVWLKDFAVLRLCLYIREMEPVWRRATGYMTVTAHS